MCGERRNRGRRLPGRSSRQSGPIRVESASRVHLVSIRGVAEHAGRLTKKDGHDFSCVCDDEILVTIKK